MTIGIFFISILDSTAIVRRSILAERNLPSKSQTVSPLLASMHQSQIGVDCSVSTDFGNKVVFIIETV